MDNYYFFFDRSAMDSLWNLSWQEFLRRHGKSRWAKGQNTGDGAGSLRGLIAFSVEPEPSAEEIEDIIRRRTLRWTIQRSSLQFYMMEEIVYNVPRLRKFSASLDIWSNDFTVLLAAAAEGYFRGEVRHVPTTHPCLRPAARIRAPASSRLCRPTTIRRGRS